MALRDFDRERQQRHAALPTERFTIAGRTFTIRHSIAPDVFLPWLDMTGDEDMRTTLDIAWSAIEACIVETDQWRAARDERDPALTIDMDDVLALLPFLLEQVTGRPTAADTSSSDGSATTGTPSTEQSSWPAAPASPDSTSDPSPTSPTPTSTPTLPLTLVPSSTGSSPRPTPPIASPSVNGEPTTSADASLKDSVPTSTP